MGVTATIEFTFDLCSFRYKVLLRLLLHCSLRKETHNDLPSSFEEFAKFSQTVLEEDTEQFDELEGNTSIE